jgi:uncharacterized protein (TIGR02996 family)
METAPSFARSYNATAHGLISAIRDNPTDDVTWQVFGDWLEEQGLPRPGKIKAGARLPRNG